MQPRSSTLPGIVAEELQHLSVPVPCARVTYVTPERLAFRVDVGIRKRIPLLVGGGRSPTRDRLKGKWSRAFENSPVAVGIPELGDLAGVKALITELEDQAFTKERRRRPHVGNDVQSCQNVWATDVKGRSVADFATGSLGQYPPDGTLESLEVYAHVAVVPVVLMRLDGWPQA